MGSDNEEETAASSSQTRSRKQAAAKRQQQAILYDDFKAQTSMHGLWSIAAARGGIKKTFWLLVTLGAIIACIYQMTTILLQYYQYDVTVSKTFTFQRQTPFPAVTFCNMNPVKRSTVSTNSLFSQLTSQKANSRRRRSDEQQQPIETRHEQQRPMETAIDDVMYESPRCHYHATSVNWKTSWSTRTVYSCAKKAIYDRNVFAISTLPRVTEYCVINGGASAITWSAASAVCSSLGYKLAVLDSQDEVAFVWSNQLWLINTLTPVKYWIGLNCTSAGSYSWYDGTAYSYNYWVSPAPSCSSQCAYGDGTNSTQWSVDSPSAAYSALCYKDGYPLSPTYTCGYKSNFADGGLDYEFCYIEGDSTTTWTQAQGICLSLNYSSLVVTDSINKYNFIIYDDDKYFPSGTKYWIGLSVSTEADCTSYSYTWIDGSTSSWNVWTEGLIGYPACSLAVPTLGPYGCVNTHNDYSRDYQPADCQSTYAFICQRVTNSCNSNPCLNNGTCNNFINGYTCTCTSSYTGVNCQTAMLTTQAATTMPVTTTAQTTLSPTTQSVTTVPSTTQAKITTLAATTEPLTTLAVSTEMTSTQLKESALSATSTVASTTIEHTTAGATIDTHTTTIAQTTTPSTTVTSASVVVSTLTAHSLTLAESSTVNQPLTLTHSPTLFSSVQSTLPGTTTKLNVQEEVSTVPQTNQSALESTTTFAKSTMTATKSSIATTRRTTSSTTPPTSGGPSPTNAPLTDSSIPGRVAQNEQTQQAQQLTQILAGLPTNEKQQLGYQATDFLLDCQYAGYSCSPSDDFMSFYNSIHGNCYVFNSGWNSTVPRLNVSRVGSRYALKVILNIKQDEYITTGNEAAGARLVIHSQDAMPYPEDAGLLIKPGMLTSVHVSRTDYHRMAAPFGHCIDANIASADMDIYTELYPVKYDHIGCYRTCFQLHMIHTCGCADSSLPNAGAALYNGSYPICNLTNIVQNDCNYNLTRQFVLNQLSCNCPLACDQIQYNTYVTQSFWPTIVDEKSILLALRPKIQSIVEQPVNDTTKFMRNLLRVEIYFDNLNLITITETAAYTLEEVLTNLSASLGAWVGVACMTFAEALDLFMDYLVLTWYFIFFRNRARIDRKR